MLLIVLSFTQAALAFTLGFGGRITSIKFCFEGLMLTLSPPSPGTYLFSYGTRLYAFYMIRPGVWLLGKRRPGGRCSFPCGIHVCTIPTQYTIIETGTSI